MVVSIWWVLLFAVTLPVLYLYYKFAYAPYQIFKQLGIPGPTPTPFFGHYLEFEKLGILRFEKHICKRYGSVSGYFTGQVPMVLITDVDMIKEVMVKDFGSFMNRRGVYKTLENRMPRGMVFAQGERWKFRRTLVSPTFSTSKLKTVIPIMERSVKVLMEVVGEAADTGRSVDMCKLFLSFTMENILATAFGRAVNVQRGEADEMTKAATSLFGDFKGRFLLDQLLFSNFPWLDKVLPYFMSSRTPYNLLQNLALKFVKTRREEGQRKHKDLLQLLLDATLDGKEKGVEELINTKGDSSSTLSDDEVVLVCIDFLLAGYETTGTSLSCISYLLALNPKVQETLQSEIHKYYQDNPTATTYDAISDIKYLDMVIQEALRLYPIGSRLGRRCNKGTSIGGFRIPEGCFVIIPFHILHEDPEYWPDPHKFDPMRFTAEEKAKRPQMCHMPFGAGPRNCVGMRFALLEIKMALLDLMKGFSFTRAPDTEVPLKTVLGITMSPLNGIYLNISKRSNFD